MLTDLVISSSLGAINTIYINTLYSQMGTLAQTSLLRSKFVYSTSESDNIAWMSDKHLKLYIQSRTSNCPPENMSPSLPHISIAANSVLLKAQAQTLDESSLTLPQTSHTSVSSSCKLYLRETGTESMHFSPSPLPFLALNSHHLLPKSLQQPPNWRPAFFLSLLSNVTVTRAR